MRQKLVQSTAIQPSKTHASKRNTNKQASRFAAVLARRMEMGTAFVTVTRKVVV